MIRVGIFGDSTMIQAGLLALVGDDPALEVVEEPEDCDVLIQWEVLGYTAAKL